MRDNIREQRWRGFTGLVIFDEKMVMLQNLECGYLFVTSDTWCIITHKSFTNELVVLPMIW